MVLQYKTDGKRSLLDITDRLQQQITIDNGVVSLFVQHTTAAITTADLDPGGTVDDYLDAFEELVPKLAYRHPHDPSHMPDHILSSLIGPQLAIPVANGRLALGTWQRIVLVECDGPRERNVVLNEMNEPVASEST